MKINNGTPRHGERSHYCRPAKKGVIAACALLLTYASAALAVPITFELSTVGRLQSGPIIVEPSVVTLTYTFDSDAPDAEPSPAGGSFSSAFSAHLQIGSESASNSGSGVAIFTGFDGTPQTYTVGAVFSRNAAYFLGREFFVGIFNFIDFDRMMLTNDNLPTDPGFVLEAERYFSTLTFVPIPGDPAYGTEGYTQFQICDPRVVEACVNAPLTLRRIALDDDNDGVSDAEDVCPDTVIPETVPTVQLGVNRFALTSNDTIFDTVVPRGRETQQQPFTIEDTKGCSCEQIIGMLGLGQGH